MIYRAKEPKFLWILLFIVTLTYAYALDSVYSFFAYFILFLFFAAMTTSYLFEIEEDSFVYEVRMLGVVISKRKIESNEVEKIHIIHAGPRTIVLINVKKGMRLKLHRFAPSGYEEHVQQFARRHAISVETTGEK